MADNAPQMKDDWISKQQKAGIQMRDQQMTGRPRFAFAAPQPQQSDFLVNALLGTAQGLPNVLETSKLQDPLLSALAGALGGLGAPTAQDIRLKQQKSQNELAMQEFEMTPLAQISKPIVEKYPALANMTIGQAKQVLPLLKDNDDMEKIILRYGLQAKLQEQRDAAKGNRLTVDDPDEARSLAQARNLPFEMIYGKDRRTVNSLLAAASQVQPKVNAMLEAEKAVKVLKNMWERAKKEGTGPIEGRLKLAGSAISGGDAYTALAAYEEQRRAMVTSLRKLFADSGAPSNFDVESFLASIPSVKKGEKLGDEKWVSVQEMVNGGKSSLTRAFPLAHHMMREVGGGVARDMSEMSDEELLAELDK